jgi:hypothetical protein
MLFAGAAGSAVFVLIGLVGAEDLKSGPNAAKFYEDYGGGSREDFHAQLLADFGEIVRKNKEKIDMRAGILSGALSWAILWAIAFGLVRALS